MLTESLIFEGLKIKLSGADKKVYRWLMLFAKDTPRSGQERPKRARAAPRRAQGYPMGAHVDLKKRAKGDP